MNNLDVKKSNKLIEARYKLNLIEQKIILYAVSQLDSSQEDFNIQRIDIKTLAELIGSSEHRYSEIRKVVRGLRKKELIIKTDEKELITGWLSSIEFQANSPYIELEFSKKLIPYLLSLEGKYKAYKLKNIVKIGSAYGIRLYELLKQYENMGTKQRIFKLDEFKHILGIENKYKRYFDLKERVLEPAKKEINKYTDLVIDYKPLKTGRKIDEIEFSIKRTHVELLSKQYTIAELQDLKIKCGLEKFDISDEKFATIYETAADVAGYNNIDLHEYIKQTYKYMLSREETIGNPYGYVLKGVKDGFEKVIDKAKRIEGCA